MIDSIHIIKAVREVLNCELGPALDAIEAARSFDEWSSLSPVEEGFYWFYRSSTNQLSVVEVFKTGPSTKCFAPTGTVPLADDNGHFKIGLWKKIPFPIKPHSSVPFNFREKDVNV